MAQGRKTKTLNELMKLAKEYNVADNALFLAAAEQYDLQIKVIQMIKDNIEKADSMTCEKVYRAGEKNLYADPLIRELPKHSDAANRTLGTLLDIITKLGHKTEAKSGLAAFEEEFS